MKKPAPKLSPALSPQNAAARWKRKRRAIFPCVAVGLILLTAGFLLREDFMGKPLLAAAKNLNTACRRCPRCGHINASAQSILHGFICTRCGYTISDT